MHVGPQREARIGVTEPFLYLLDILAAVEQQRRAGMPERVERRAGAKARSADSRRQEHWTA
jgi:hypothetical protein